MKKVGLRFNSNLALWSWAAACGMSFELTQAKFYESPGPIWLSSVCLREASYRKGQPQVADGNLSGQDGGAGCLRRGRRVECAVDKVSETH